MKPILIEVTEPITIEKLRECVNVAYEAGKEDGKRENQFVISTTPSTIPNTIQTTPLSHPVPCVDVSNIEINRGEYGD